MKERILEFLATIILLKQRGQNAMARSPVLLFVGLQGIGKTTLAISIAEALDRKFYRIAMGAIGSTLEIRGKNKGNHHKRERTRSSAKCPASRPALY